MSRLNNRNIPACLLALAILFICLSCIKPVPRTDVDVVPVKPTVIMLTPTIVPLPTPVTVLVQPTKTPEPKATLAPTPTPIPAVIPTPTTAPPPELFLEITDPKNNIVVSSGSILVSGSTLPTAVLEINSVRATVDVRGEFVKNIPLDPGQNVVELIVEGEDGNKIRDFLIIRYNPPLPFEFFLLVDTPSNGIRVAEQIMQVSGQTSPIATVLVNGEKVTVDQSGDFHTYLQLQPGNNNIKVSASNRDGKLLTDTRKVFFVP
tara:strand:+ start:3489 stop:4274 length:786 start_codon:yes stop_codon:yes gene_type:complete